MKVSVENIGTLEFPDGTDPVVVEKTIKNLVGKKKEKPTGFVGKYLPSIGRTADIYKEEVASGQGAIKTALEQPTGKNIVRGAIGVLQYGFSPFTAAAKGLVGEPVQQSLERIGAIKDVRVPVYGGTIPEFVGEMAETAAYFVPYGAAVQKAIVGKEAMQTLSQAEQVMKSVGTAKKALQYPTGMSKKTIDKATKPVSKSSEKVLKRSVVDEVVSKVKQPVSATWKPGEKRITQQIVDYMMQNPQEIKKVASKYKLAPDELAAQIKHTMTLSGQELQRMGKLAKEIRSKFQTPYMKQLSAALEKDLPEVMLMDKFGTAFRVAENVRRSALISQFATTFRNIISQGARVGLGSIDDAFQGAGKAYFKSAGKPIIESAKSTLRGLGEGLDLLTSTVNRMRPSQRRKLIKLLESQNALNAKATMFTTPVQDVVMTGKVTKALSYFNRVQEYFFRNITFEAKLKQLARQAGINFKHLGPQDIPEKMFDEAARYAVEMTFAAMPKSKFAADWVRSMTHPIMTAFVNPFPRFLYGNALPFLKNFSPLGFLEAARPSVVADIVGGNPEKFVKAISQASLGTIMLNTASFIRNSKHAGEKWYEVKVGEKSYDTRAFAPFSTYLFLAESMQNPEKIKPSDFGMALLSLNRIGGTGLVIADVMRAKDAATMVDPLKRMAGAYVSGFSVPARTLKDIYSYVDPEEAIIRDVKGNEFWGPTIQNIPGYSQSLPEAVTPLKVGPIKTEQPLLRQFSGLSYKIKNDLQKEVDELQVPYTTIYPRTGNAEGDRVVSRIMSHVLDSAYPRLQENSTYTMLDNLTKRIVLSELFREAKRSARDVLLQTNPSLALKIKIDNIPDDIQKLLQRKGVLPGGG